MFGPSIYGLATFSPMKKNHLSFMEQVITVIPFRILVNFYIKLAFLCLYVIALNIAGLLAYRIYQKSMAKIRVKFIDLFSISEMWTL